jgi:hypothetical protein
MTFGKDKLAALRALASRIVDRRNNYTILDAFTYSSDKRKAKRILGS